MADTTDTNRDEDAWPADLAIAACLRVIADDLSNGTADGFSPLSAPVEALEEGGMYSPRSEKGFRAWLGRFHDLSEAEIDAAVAAVRRAGGLEAPDEPGPAAVAKRCAKCGGPLDREQMAEMLGEMREILWPGGDPDAEWEEDTIEEVARVLSGAGLRPDAPARAGGG